MSACKLKRLVAVTLLVCCSPLEALDLGAATQIWPFMWRDGASLVDQQLPASNRIKADVAAANLDRYRSLGASWNIVNVFQDVDGPDEFRRLKRVIEEHESRGIEVALRILEVPELYDRIDGKFSSEYGYSREYYRWLTGLLNAVGGHARYLMISNETDHDIGYNRSFYRGYRRIRAEEYRRLLITAVLAVARSGIDVPVLDHGISAYSLCLTVIDDLLAVDPTIAAEFWRSMQYDTGSWARNEKSVRRLVSNKESRRRIEFVREYLSAPLPVDFLQLHHYFGPEIVPQLIAWLNSNVEVSRDGESGRPLPIVVGEFGYRVPVKPGKTFDGRKANVADWDRYDESSHARSLSSNVAALSSHGIESMLYWHVRFQNDRSPTATLFRSQPDAGLFEPVQAASAYGFAANALSGRRSVDAPSCFSDLSRDGLRFVSFDGEPFLSVVTSETGRLESHALADLGASNLHDYLGRPVEAGSKGVVPGPVYAFWGAEGPCAR